jgi:hypothetical protein
VQDQRQPARGPGLCLFCLEREQLSKSVEHIVSEALGNDTLILPPGVVCDRCNSGTLSRIDEKLLSFPPIQMMRVMRQLPSKAGKPPTGRFSNGRILSHEGNQIVVDSSSIRFMQGSGPNTNRITAQMANLDGRHVEAVSRSLLKSALECAYLDLGYDAVISSEWDDVRSAIISGGYHGYVALPVPAAPGTDPLQVQYKPGLPERNGFRLFVQLNVYGIRLITVLGHSLPTCQLTNAAEENVAQVLAFPHEGRYGGDLSIDVEFTYGSVMTFAADDPSLPDFLRSTS